MTGRLAWLCAALGCTAGAVSVVGTSPPWVSEIQGQPVAYRQTSAAEALRELYAGRADLALVSLPGPPAPKGTGPLEYLPLKAFAVRLAYRLPGVDLSLDIKTACRIFAGKVSTWNHRDIAALNPDIRLPQLPILTTVRSVPNAASRVFADTCVAGGWWPDAWRKSSWSAGAVHVRPLRREQLADLRLTGSLGLLGPLEQAAGTQEARLRSPDGLFVDPSAELGLGPRPASPYTLLAPARAAESYPLRGVVWAVFAREQRYRGRKVQDASTLRALLEALRTEEVAHAQFRALPGIWRLPVRMTFGGHDLGPAVAGPPAPGP